MQINTYKCFVGARRSSISSAEKVEITSIVIIVDCVSGKYSAIRDGKSYVQDQPIRKGMVLFLEADDVLEMISEDKDEPVQAYQAFC